MSSDGLYNSVKAYISPVQSAYTTIAQYDDFYPLEPDLKDDEDAMELLAGAMRMSEERKYFSAFELYADSLAKAEQDGELISAIYYERAITLELTNYRNYSKEDNQRARWNGNYEEPLRKYLYYQYYRLIIGTGEASNRFFDFKPKIYGSSYNIRNPSVSLKIELRGNLFIAATRIKAGDCLIVEEPACIVPLSDYNLFCYDCMKFCLTPIPCFNCTKALFCNEGCRNYAWAYYHEYECKILPILENVKYRLATRMALHDIIGLEGYPDYPENIVLNRDCLHALKAAERGPCIPPATVNELTSNAAQVFHAVKEYTNFFDAIDSPLKYDIFKGLLLKLMYVEEAFAFRHNAVFEVTADYSVNISFSAYYPNLSHVRHSCAPNTSLCYQDGTIEIKALRNIYPGQEITILGNYHYTITGKEVRQRLYKNRYFSDCHCEACQKDWPFLFQLGPRYPTYVMSNIKDVYMRFKTYKLNPEIMWSLFSQLLIRRNWRRPSLEYAFYEYTFRIGHAYIMWRSLHHLYDFMRYFPNSV